MKMKWRGDAAARQITRRLGSNLPKAADEIVETARHLISIQGPPRSEPGDPPHQDSGRLHDSLYAEIDAAGLAARFGSTEEHASTMEIGTPHGMVAPRPWLLPACLLSADDAARRLAK